MPVARHQQSLRETFGSLRLRLTVWNTAVVLLMVLFTLWGVRVGLRFALWHEADEQLIEDAREVKLIYERDYPDWEKIKAELDGKAGTHTHRGLHMRIFDDQRTPIWNTSTAPAVPFPAELIAHGMKPITAGTFRLVHAEVDRPGVPKVTIRVGTSFQPLEDDIALITRLLIIVGSIALFVSPLGGFWLAGRATRPIAQIIDTTKRLHPTSLDERLPLRGTRDELDRLSSTINGFLDRMADYLQQNREFTANAAHELRSPLAAIQNSLEVALNSDRSIAEYQETLTELLGECEALRILVNHLLLLAENDAAGLLRAGEVVRLDQVIERAYDMFLGVAESESISLRLGRLDPARVVGDHNRLRQVVNNLIDNAIKYTRAGGDVLILLTTNPADRTVRMTVRDTGVGIPPADLPHIFDRFYRGDKSRHRDRQGRGTGLGLAICQSIVQGYEGRLEVDSALDRGTTFTVILPEAPAEDAATAAAALPGSAAAAVADPEDGRVPVNAAAGAG